LKSLVSDKIREEGIPAVELRSVTKTFGAVCASRAVSLSIARGSIHAIIGENGAGKSTAVNMLYGMFAPDSGEILVNGAVRAWRSPRDAAQAGIGMVHQHFMLAGRCSGLDNIILGTEPAHARWRFIPNWVRPIDRTVAKQRLESLALANQLKVDLDRCVEDLPVGMQQRLEILKLLYRDSRVLILDEPTAVLTPQEVAQLFATLRRLRDEGRSIILITHKLKEVLSLADQISVMRRGQVVGHVSPLEATEDSLAALMVGRSVTLKAEPPPAPVRQGSALQLSRVSLAGRGAKPLLADVSFSVARGEIVGIAGIEGNGQSELLKVIADPASYFGNGARRGQHKAVGELFILGQDGWHFHTAQVRALGVGIVPEDRHRQAMVLGFDLAANFLLGRQRTTPFARGGILQKKVLDTRLREAMRSYDVRPLDPTALAKSLSGGNQQKVVMARELDQNPSLFICAQPTRGVDVGAIEFIHSRILAARAAGCGVLLISSELSEIQSLSDRILVMYEGRIVAEYERDEADEFVLGRDMGGSSATKGESHGS
jgi:ABC-type uncharacterized transport system ATPase subunit